MAKRRKKNDWVIWAAGGVAVGLAALGVGLVYFGPKESRSPVYPMAPDLPNISQNPFMNYSGAGGKLYNTPLNEFNRVTSSPATTKKGCGCSAKR